MRTMLVLVCLTLLAAPEPVRAQTDPRGQASLSRLRRELRTMEALLDQTVAQVSPPNPGFVLAGAPASRGYLLRGHGVVFVPDRPGQGDIKFSQLDNWLALKRPTNSY